MRTRVEVLEAPTNEDGGSNHGDNRNLGHRNGGRGGRGVGHGGYQPHRYQEPTDNDERVLKTIHVEAPSYDGCLEPKVFLDWLSDMDRYFEWHDILEVRRVRFAKMKLVGQAKLFWTTVEQKTRRLGDDPLDLNWDEMKEL